MPKKNSTQVINFLNTLTAYEDDGAFRVTMTVVERDWCVALLKKIDQRDEQRQVKRKRAKKAAR